MADNIHEILIKLMWLCIIVGIGVVCTLIMLRIARKAIKKADRDPLLEFFFVNMIKVVMVFVIVGISLEKLSILHPSHFITLLGVVGAAIALAIRDTLANIAGGINIIMTLPFGHGDYVCIDEAEGVVEQTKLMMTTLRTPDNKQVTIPNNKVANSVITNYSARDIRRIEPVVMINAGDDMNKVRDILLDITTTCPMVLREPAPFVGVGSTKYGTVEVTFRIWCNTADCDEVLFFMNENIKEKFDVAGIGPGRK